MGCHMSWIGQVKRNCPYRFLGQVSEALYGLDLKQVYLHEAFIAGVEAFVLAFAVYFWWI